MELTELLRRIDALHTELAELRPLPAEALKRINDAVKVEYTYDSNRIEGNTLTLQETALVVGEGMTIAGKSMREHLEAINHAEAVEYIRDLAADTTPITASTICGIHSIVLRGIDRENAGKYRTVPVMISGSRHTPPQPYAVAPLMEEFIAEYDRMERAAAHPVEVAAYLHDELVRIHPFIDGNGRTARLLMNLYLLRKGYPIVSLKADAETKMQYYSALEVSHTDGRREKFVAFVADAVYNALSVYLKVIRG